MWTNQKLLEIVITKSLPIRVKGILLPYVPNLASFVQIMEHLHSNIVKLTSFRNAIEY